MDIHNISTEPFQNSDSQTGQIMEKCLANPIILTELLKHFSNTELLELSLVNKMWKYQARSAIKKRGNLEARLGCDSSYPCQEEFEDFLADLEQMNVVPYSGVYMIICPADHTGRSSLDLTENFLARLPLKQLKVMLVEKTWYSKDCSAILVLKKLLKDFSAVLEEITFDIENARAKFIKHLVQDCSFPALKILKLRDNYNTEHEAYTNYMRVLVSRAPNLQELHVSGPINLMENVLEGSEAVLMHQSRVYAPFDDISENTARALTLRSVELVYPDPDFSYDRFNRIAHMLLQASCRTLRFIKMDAVFAVPLMCYGICFPNTYHRLEMAIHNNQLELDEPRILSIVKDFDFTRTFPNVNEVEILCRRSAPEFSPDHLNAIMEQADAVLREPMLDRAVNIKKLHICSSDFSSATVPFYVEMFPNIEKLEVSTIGEQKTPFISIWQHWTDLEQLEVYYERIIPKAANLDSVFCGIFPEEVAELRLKDDEYLSRVNIVPIMPAFTCVRRLKTLILEYWESKDEPFVDDGTFVFSKVAALVALARCPAIPVSLKICSYSNPPAMTRLKPYLSVQTVILDEFDY